MRSLVAWTALMIGCSRVDRVPASGGAPAMTGVIAAVGAKPHLVASVLVDAEVRSQLAAVAALTPSIGGASLDTCGVAIDRLTAIRIAIGEPLRIAAEVDGVIDADAVACVFGPHLMAVVKQAGLTLRDRPGGLAIDRDVTSAIAAGALARDLISRCEGTSCLAAWAGVAGREIWTEVRYGAVTKLRIHGPGFHGAGAFVAAIKAAKLPGLEALTARDEAGALVVELSADTAGATTAARALRSDLIEAFRIPSSSMTPTLMQGDHVFVGKGPLEGPIAPGDLIVYRGERGTFIKRLIARGPATIAATGEQFVVNGVALPSEMIDPAYQFIDQVEPDPSSSFTVHGSRVREHLAGRSYITLQTGTPHDGSWTVPAGELFLLGDNRDNSNDSRFVGPTKEADVVGKVLGIWFASRDGIPDWERIGIAPE